MRIGLAGVVAVSLVAALVAEGQQAAKVPRIGVLSNVSAAENPSIRAFDDGLRE